MSLSAGTDFRALKTFLERYEFELKALLFVLKGAYAYDAHTSTYYQAVREIPLSQTIAGKTQQPT